MMLVALLGFSALSVDMGYYRQQQRHQQIATDAAAIAGAQEYLRGNSSVADMAAAVTTDASTNGYSSPKATVTANPSYSSPYTNGNTAVEVKISQQYPQFFGAIFGGGKRTVVTRAVAALESSAAGCIVTLDPTLQTAVHSLIGPNCAVVTAGCPKTTGTIDVGAFTYSTAGCGPVKNATFTDAQPTLALQPTDPCSTIPDCNAMSSYTPPPAASCTSQTSTPITSSNTSPIGGCYNNVGKVSGCSGKGSAATITLNGLYVFEGTGIDFQGCSVASGPSGVTIYLANSAAFNVGGSVFSVSAPSGSASIIPGSYASGQAGMLFYGPNAANAVTTANGTTITATGIWYFPKSTITLNGALGSTFTGGVIARQYVDNGNTRFLDPSSILTGGDQQTAYLVE
jgi:hypothetical protein